MIYKSSKGTFWAGILLVGLFFHCGCSTSGISRMSAPLKDQGALDEVLSSGMTSEEMILSAEESLDEARHAELAFFSPKLFEASVQSVKEARRLLNLGAKPRKIAGKIVQVRQSLDLAYASKKLVEDLLSIGLSEKKLLDELEAETHFPADYAKIMALFKTINIKIGERRLEQATAMESELTAATSALLVQILEKIILKESKEFLVSAQENEARQYAPKTCMEAEIMLIRATTFIRTYPRDRAGIDGIAARSLNKSKHAYYVTEQVRTLAGMDTAAIEDFILALEGELAKAGELIGSGGTVFMPLNEQVAALKGAAEEMAGRAARVGGLEAEIAALKKEVEVVGGKAARLDGLMADKESGEQALIMLKMENGAVKDELKEVRRALVLKNMELDKVMALKGPLDDVLKAYVARVSELEYEAKQAEAAMAEALKRAEENAALKNDLDALEADRNNDRGELERLRHKVRELNGRLKRQARAENTVDASVSGQF